MKVVSFKPRESQPDNASQEFIYKLENQVIPAIKYFFKSKLHYDEKRKLVTIN